MVRQKESFNDENAFIDEDEENADGYDEEQDWMPILVDEDEEK